VLSHGTPTPLEPLKGDRVYLKAESAGPSSGREDLPIGRFSFCISPAMIFLGRGDLLGPKRLRRGFLTGDSSTKLVWRLFLSASRDQFSLSRSPDSHTGQVPSRSWDSSGPNVVSMFPFSLRSAGPSF